MGLSLYGEGESGVEEVLKTCVADARIGADTHCTVMSMWTMEGKLAVKLVRLETRGRSEHCTVPQSVSSLDPHCTVKGGGGNVGEAGC